jgi:hypothetical protein
MVIGRRAFLTLAAAAVSAPAFAVQGSARGRVEEIEPPGLAAASVPRVRVWLPPGYDRAEQPHRVLYLADGQWAFAGDADGFNFAADRRIASLIAAGRVPSTIIVAVDNNLEDRFRQYLPQAIYDQSEGDLRAALDRELAGRPILSEPYLRFLAADLKPFIDRRYRTVQDRAGTAFIGASTAGLIAAAAFVEAQAMFGRAACISPQWPIYDLSMIDYSQLLSLWPDYFARLGPPAGRRLWLDHGTREIDAGMGQHQLRIARRLETLGWRPGRDLEARVHAGAGHAFTNATPQLDDVLTWLFV